MDSTLTLVNALELTFTPNNMNNTIIADATSQQSLYKVKTNAHNDKTEITDVATGEVMALLLRSLLGDVVVFPQKGKDRIKVKSWMKANKAEDG